MANTKSNCHKDKNISSFFIIYCYDSWYDYDVACFFSQSFYEDN